MDTFHPMLRRLEKTLRRVNILKHNNCPANIYLFKVNNRKNTKKCELLCEKRCQWRCSGVFIINFEHISHLFLVFQLLTLNKQMLAVYSCHVSWLQKTWKNCKVFKGYRNVTLITSGLNQEWNWNRKGRAILLWYEISKNLNKKCLRTKCCRSYIFITTLNKHLLLAFLLLVLNK